MVVQQAADGWRFNPGASLSPCRGDICGQQVTS
jgi:hypothetical protein